MKTYTVYIKRDENGNNCMFYATIRAITYGIALLIANKMAKEIEEDGEAIELEGDSFSFVI